jgi:hypothetical protein
MPLRLRLLLPLLLATPLWPQAPVRPPRPAMSYEVETPPNNVRFDLRRVQGIAVDRAGMVIPRVGVGLFTDDPAHHLLAMVITGEDGKFDFGKAIPDGNYRLVAKYPGLCTANIPLALSHKTGSRHHLELRMEYPGLDVCSYALAK